MLAFTWSCNSIFFSFCSEVLDICHSVPSDTLLTLHGHKNNAKILVWSLPDLILQHEVYTAADLTCFVRGVRWWFVSWLKVYSRHLYDLILCYVKWDLDEWIWESEMFKWMRGVLKKKKKYMVFTWKQTILINYNFHREDGVQQKMNLKVI